MRTLVVLCVLILSFLPLAAGDTYVVCPDGSGDYLTILEAINVASDGDVIELCDGVFSGPGNRDLSYAGKAITITSQSGDPELCVLDCEGTATDRHRGFIFESGETPASVLSGISITNAWAPGVGTAAYGGGIVMYSAPTIYNCIISNCYAFHAGGGLIASNLNDPPATIMDCTFIGNRASYGGAAAFTHYSNADVSGCLFFDNQADTQGGGVHYSDVADAPLTNCQFIDNISIGYGGAIEVWGDPPCNPTIAYCTFFGNVVNQSWGGAVHVTGECMPVFIGCTMYNNSGSAVGGVRVTGGASVVLENTIIAFCPVGSALECGTGSSATLSCCDIFGNAGGDWTGCIAEQLGTAGNISEDPLFCDPATGDLRLLPDSPCLPFTPPNPECDLIGAWEGCDPSGANERLSDEANRILLEIRLSNSFTRIAYTIPDWAITSEASLTIHDPLGRMVRTLARGVLPTGAHMANWDGTDQRGIRVSGGIYYCRLAVGREQQSRTIIVLR